MAARFLVKTAPGTPVPGVGFVRPGEVFDAPEGFTPSKRGAHLPVNAQAQALIKKCHGLDVPIVELEEPAPKKTSSGLTLAQLDALSSPQTNVEPVAPPQGGKKDRSL